MFNFSDDRVKVKMFDLTVYGFGTNDDADSTKTVICDDVTSSPKPITDNAKSEDNMNLPANDHTNKVDPHVTETAHTSDWDKLQYGLIGLVGIVVIVFLLRMRIKTLPKSV